MQNNFYRFLPALVLVLVSGLSAAATQSVDQAPANTSGMGVLPNVAMALSIEYPTAGEAYTNRTLGTAADIQRKYLGYFDPDKCYDYNDSGDYFYPVARVNNATNRTCANQKWSGNLLNWATMSAIDIFRATLTGGNRALGATGGTADYTAGDTASATYLRRAKVIAGKNQTYGFTDNARTLSYSTNTLTPFNLGTVKFSSLNWDFTVKDSSNRVLGTYRAVVKVCDNTIGLESNCAAYTSGGNTVYKPVGLIQKNGSKMRFGVFSYLKDDSYNRDGGVMRARLKRTDQSTSITTLSRTALTVGAEWSASTGQFVTNPDAADAASSSSATTTISNSGVINFINKFGDFTGYKTYDPAAELFYATLRYYRKKGSVDAYTSNMSDAMKDGFPVITDWDDPIDPSGYSCQKNYLLYIGDTNTHGDADLPGSRWRPSGNQTALRIPGDDSGLDVYAWTGRTGANPANNTGSSNSPPYIAGLAFFANTSDLRSDLSGTQTVKAFMIDTVENGGAKGETTNAFYQAAKYGGFTDSNGNGLPDVKSEWANNSQTINAYPNGVPDYFAQANNPENMVLSLQKAFENVAEQQNISLVTPAVNGAFVRPDGSTRIFRPTYSLTSTNSGSANWRGDLLMYSMDAYGSVNGSYLWSAAARIAAQTAVNRNIFTYNRATRQGASFASNAGTWLTDNFSSDGYGGTADAYAAERINYLRGDRTKEATNATPQMRPRTAAGNDPTTGSPLGDIINSTPVFIPNNGPKPAECDYNATLKAAIQARSPMVAVGANDGMLHVFKATDDSTGGTEVFAYVPNAILSKLSRLTSKSYTHEYYVDGPLAAANVCRTIASANEARTVLVGTTGAGGRGVFALDVTDATATGQAFGTSDVMWEFSSADDSALRMTVGTPQIIKVKDGVDAQGRTTYRYMVLVGSGIDNTGSTQGAVFLLDINGPGTGWVRGTNYWRLDVPAVTADASVTGDDPIAPNGIVSPVGVDINQDGTTDLIYAGDLNGNLWKFDISTTDKSLWGLCINGRNSTTGVCNDASANQPLFTAWSVTGSTGAYSRVKRQPITAQPLVTAHPSGGYMVLFGTGKLYSSNDRSDTSTQTLYGIRDNGVALGNTASASLVQQTIGSAPTAPQGSSIVGTFATTSTNSVNYTTQNGWFMNLTSTERNLASPRLLQGRVQFTTSVSSTDLCSNGGDTWVTEVNLFSGAQLPVAIYDTNGQGGVGDGDAAASRRKITGQSGGLLNLRGPNHSVVRMASTLGSEDLSSEMRLPVRVSWRELISAQ